LLENQPRVFVFIIDGTLSTENADALSYLFAALRKTGMSERKEPNGQKTESPSSSHGQPHSSRGGKTGKATIPGLIKERRRETKT